MAHISQTGSDSGGGAITAHKVHTGGAIIIRCGSGTHLSHCRDMVGGARPPKLEQVICRMWRQSERKTC